MKNKIMILCILLLVVTVYLYMPSKAAPDLIDTSSINGKASKISFGPIQGGRERTEVPDWLSINCLNMLFDKNGNVFLLNDKGRSILQYDKSGKFNRKIDLKLNVGWHAIDLRIAKKEDRFQSVIEIAKNARGGSISEKYEIDKEGNIIRKLNSNDHFYNNNLKFSGCIYREYCGDVPAEYYDKDKNLIPVPPGFGFFSDGSKHYIKVFKKGKIKKYRSFGFPLLTKIYPSALIYKEDYWIYPGHFALLDLPVWSKNPPPYADEFQGVGFDGDGNFYVITYRIGTLENKYLVRINPAGSISGIIKVPDELYKPAFLSDMKDSEIFDKGGSFESSVEFQLLCDGTIYAYYNMTNYSDKALKKWVQHGEYFMYKFQFDNI